MRWFRYRHKWAYGIDKEWTYIELGESDYETYFADDSESSEEDFIEDYEVCKEWNWSERYRGIDYDVVDRIPREILEKKIKRAESAAASWKKTAERYCKELESYLNETSSRVDAETPS
jgi:hypothetical protein